MSLYDVLHELCGSLERPVELRIILVGPGLNIVPVSTIERKLITKTGLFKLKECNLTLDYP